MDETEQEKITPLTEPPLVANIPLIGGLYDRRYLMSQNSADRIYFAVGENPDSPLAKDRRIREERGKRFAVAVVTQRPEDVAPASLPDRPRAATERTDDRNDEI